MKRKKEERKKKERRKKTNIKRKREEERKKEKGEERKREKSSKLPCKLIFLGVYHKMGLQTNLLLKHQLKKSPIKKSLPLKNIN